MSLIRNGAKDLDIAVKFFKRIKSRRCVYLQPYLNDAARTWTLEHRPTCHKRYGNQEAWCGACLAEQALLELNMGDTST